MVLIPDLAEETYRQGLRVLRHVLELVQVIPSSDEAVLGEEVIRLEREIEALRNDTSQASLVKVRLQTLVYYQYRLSLQEQQSLRVEELLSQAGRCEASLNQARMQLVLLSAAESQQGADAVTETLSRVIQQAKEVQQELNELGF